MNSFEEFFKEQPIRQVSKGEVLVRPGQNSSESFYVVKGCLRSYITDVKGKDHIYQFAPEDWIISDLEFVKNKSGATLSIDAIEDSEVKEIPRDKMYSILDNDPSILQALIQKFQNRVYTLQNRVLQLLSYTAEERYISFMNTYPNLYHRVPLKMVASYLGVTPESLSRVRKELLKTK
ncbi:MAG: Crp/Fnr family transcriptional regulator [Cytophagaceae bacterium]|jgi:CRP-like cAMP-binding protein|nr:Crp/Fnr family transcriptional regulator [Cytophagaceae bacterium]